MRPANEDEKKNRTPRCGDHVFHGKSGESWVVAYADKDRDEISWAGWPDGGARLQDCVLTGVADDADHDREVAEWVSGGGRRAEQVRRLYPDAWKRAVAAQQARDDYRATCIANEEPIG
jgi:hypothetical protein